MGWNGMTGAGGEGFDATLEEREAEIDARNSEFEKENSHWLFSNSLPPFKQRVKETVEELKTEEEAQEMASFFLMRGEEDGILDRMMEVLKEEGLLNEENVRVQAAALEATYRMFSW